MSTWSELNNEGVRLAGEGDLAAARDKLAAALAVAPPEVRAQSLLNLAQVVDLTGERQHAVDLLTEALAMVAGPARAMVVAARAGTYSRGSTGGTRRGRTSRRRWWTPRRQSRWRCATAGSAC